MTQRYSRHPDLRLTALAGEGVVLHLGSRRYFTVNETGLVVLEALQQPREFTELVAVVCAEFEVTPEVATETIQAFLAQCLDAAVIRADADR